MHRACVLCTRATGSIKVSSKGLGGAPFCEQTRARASEAPLAVCRDITNVKSIQSPYTDEDSEEMNHRIYQTQ
jgi:hypothetical protein